jgi:branched-chain amino acid transport system substrate-binding protein
MWRCRAPLALLILLLAAGPASAQQPSGMAPYVVGAICSLTGRDAPVGMAQRDALLLLTEQINAKGGINGHPLRVIVEDDASDSVMAVKAVKKLIEQDYVHGLIGPNGTPQGLAVLPIVANAHVPLLSTADGVTSPLNPWVFRVPPTLVMEVDRILSHLLSQRIQRVGLLYDAEPYGTSARDVLRMMKPRYDVAMVIVEESFSASDTDMTGQLSRLKTAGTQAVVAWGSNPGLAIIARNAEQLQIPLVMMNSRAMVGTDLLSRTGYAPDHVVLVAGKLVVADQLPASDLAKKPSQAFSQDFWSRFNRQANSYAGYAWDALGVLVSAFRKTGADRVRLRDEVEKTTHFIGVSGVYTYSPTNHDGPYCDPNLVLVRASQGRWELVKNFWGMGAAAWSPPATDTVRPELGPVTVTPTALTHQGGEVALAVKAADNVGVARVLLTQTKPNGEQNSGIVSQVAGTQWGGVWRTNWRIAANSGTTAQTYTIKVKVNDVAGNSVEAQPIALTVAGRPAGSSPVLGTQPPHGAAAHPSPPAIPQATQGPATPPGSQVSRAPQSSVPQTQQRPQVAQPAAPVAQGAWLAMKPATAQDVPLAQSLNARLHESSRGWGAAARSVSVEVANGAVRLTGKVATAQERAAIESTVRSTQGVRSVTDAIVVAP